MYIYIYIYVYMYVCVFILLLGCSAWVVVRKTVSCARSSPVQT